MARTAEPIKWLPLETTDGKRKGHYAVAGGEIRVLYEGREKRAAAVTNHIRQATGEDDEGLARVMLAGEFGDAEK